MYYLGKNFGVIAVLISLIVMQGCGFHLRGRVPLPPELSHVHIISKEHSIRAKLSSAIESSGGTIVDSRENATAILTVYRVTKGRNVKAVSGQGRVREFTITYTVDFSVKTPAGKILVPRQHVSKARDFAFNEVEVMGKSVEETIIVTELEREAIPGIMRKLQHIITDKKPTEQAQR